MGGCVDQYNQVVRSHNVHKAVRSEEIIDWQTSPALAKGSVMATELERSFDGGYKMGFLVEINENPDDLSVLVWERGSEKLTLYPANHVEFPCAIGARCLNYKPQLVKGK